MRFRTTMATAALLAAGAGAAAAQQPVNGSVSAGPTDRVQVSVPAGQVRVVGWARNEVRVTGTTGSADDRLELRNDGGGVQVRIVSRRSREPRGSNVEVSVPVRARVAVNGHSVGITVDRVDGDLELHSANGAIQVMRSRARRIEATSMNGGVDVNADADRVEASSTSGAVRVAGTARESVEANTVSGAVNVLAVTPRVEANTVSGVVTVGAVRGRAEVSSVSGEVHVAGRDVSGEFQTVTGRIVLTGDLSRDGSLELTTHSGDVVLQLARGTSADVQVSSFSGSVNVDYPGARVTRPTRNETRVVVGGGDARVAVNTFSGDVRVANP